MKFCLFNKVVLYLIWASSLGLHLSATVPPIVAVSKDIDGHFATAYSAMSTVFVTQKLSSDCLDRSDYSGR